MTDLQLTPRQQVQRVLSGQPATRPVAGPLAVHYCAKLAGVSLAEYTMEAKTLADCVLAYRDQFAPDAVWVSADTWITAEAMGATVGQADQNQPAGGVGPPRVRTPADIDTIPDPDPEHQGRWPLMIEALRRVRSGVGTETFVVGCFDQYPFSLACALMGIDQVMLKLSDDRPMIEALMQRAAQYTLAYAQALAQAGADMLSGGDSPAGLLGPRMYREVVLPVQQQLITQLKSSVAVPVSLHICGNTTHLLHDMAATGADVLELDHQVDIRQACRLVGPEVTIWGNLDPVGLLARGTPDKVRAECQSLLETVQAANHHRFVLSSGCTLALETPPENVHAMLEVTRN
jgi:MtaA/CmuA family methyltransferase